eukprot:684344-Hanusia_phi.AAC.1
MLEFLRPPLPHYHHHHHHYHPSCISTSPKRLSLLLSLPPFSRHLCSVNFLLVLPVQLSASCHINFIVPFSLPLCLPVCPSVRLSVCPSARLPVCPSARLPVCLLGVSHLFSPLDFFVETH